MERVRQGKYVDAPTSGDALEVLLTKIISGLREQVKEKVPETGVFEVVYEREDVSEMKIGLSHLILKVSSPKYEDGDVMRFLELGAVNYPSPYGAETVLCYGTTQAVLAKLGEEGLLELLMKKVPKLVEDIEYEEAHPYG